MQPVDRNTEEETDEAEYVATLAAERHLFAWCLIHYGGRAPADAVAEAEAWYAYEPASASQRWLIFHDEAWHWAMARLFGAGYWQARADLARPSEAYRLEAKASGG